MAEARNANDLEAQSREAAEYAEDGEGPLADMDRVEVYQATGMLIAALDVDAAEALVRLRAHAIATGQTATQVAKAIIERRLMLDRDNPAGRPDPDGTGRSAR